MNVIITDTPLNLLFFFLRKPSRLSLFCSCTQTVRCPTVKMSSDRAQEELVALHPKQPPEPTTYPTTYPTYPTYTPGYQLTGGPAAPTVSQVNNTEEKKEEEKAEEEYEPGSIPVEHLNVRSVCGQGARSNKLR